MNLKPVYFTSGRLYVTASLRYISITSFFWSSVSFFIYSAWTLFLGEDSSLYTNLIFSFVIVAILFDCVEIRLQFFTQCFGLFIFLFTSQESYFSECFVNRSRCWSRHFRVWAIYFINDNLFLLKKFPFDGALVGLL